MIRAEIFDEEPQKSVIITVNRVRDTNNFDFILTTPENILPYEGTIYNHDGDGVELVRKVLDGWTMLRKD